jgi:hypothetical protein
MQHTTRVRQAEVVVPAAAAVEVVAVTGVVTAETLEAAALSLASHSSLKKLRPLVTG